MWASRDALRIYTRQYATVARSFKGKGPPLSLEHFLQRQKVIALWRDICRAANKIRIPSTQTEMRKFARDEFEHHRAVKDIGHIRYLISTGRTQFDSMKRYIDEQAMR